MPVRSDQFETVAYELVGTAVAIANNRIQAGFNVTVEPIGDYFPSVPALKLVRRPETTFVEIGGQRLPKQRLDDWVAYAISCSSDTRIIYCTNMRVSETSEAWLRQRKIGLIAFRDGAVVEHLPPHDLALPLGLPDKKYLKLPVRRKLIRAYEKNEKGDWRGGFEEACKSFENDCRRYLTSPQVHRRIHIQTRRDRPAARSDPAAIRRMTLGQLGVTFEKIVGPNQIESRIGKVLKNINPDRINIAHAKKRGEARLRKNVGRHMLSIIGCMREM